MSTKNFEWYYPHSSGWIFDDATGVLRVSIAPTETSEEITIMDIPLETIVNLPGSQRAEELAMLSIIGRLIAKAPKMFELLEEIEAYDMGIFGEELERDITELLDVIGKDPINAEYGIR